MLNDWMDVLIVPLCKDIKPVREVNVRVKMIHLWCKNSSVFVVQGVGLRNEE